MTTHTEIRDYETKLEARREMRGPRAIARPPVRTPGTCVHCGAQALNPKGFICDRCFDATLTRSRVVAGFTAVTCPTCCAAPFFACAGDLAHGIHAARIATALRSGVK